MNRSFVVVLSGTIKSDYSYQISWKSKDLKEGWISNEKIGGMVTD